jgi:branched-chain amino acid transport system substrate-binding protein
LLCRLATFAALLVFSTGAAHAQVSDDVPKIGVLTDLSGPAATAAGLGSVTAAQMAVEDFGGKVLGEPITVISAIIKSSPILPRASRGNGTTSTRSI